MTDPADMTDEALRMEIAEWCGWKRDTNRQDLFRSPKQNFLHTKRTIPDYPHDLNAVHEAIQSKDKAFKAAYYYALGKEVGYGMFSITAQNIELIAGATARQRCIALVKTVRGR